MAAKTKVFNGKRYALIMMGMGRRDAAGIARRLRGRGHSARVGPKEGDGACPIYWRPKKVPKD